MLPPFSSYATRDSEHNNTIVFRLYWEQLTNSGRHNRAKTRR